jgi:hypothetical protein
VDINIIESCSKRVEQQLNDLTSKSEKKKDEVYKYYYMMLLLLLFNIYFILFYFRLPNYKCNTNSWLERTRNIQKGKKKKKNNNIYISSNDESSYFKQILDFKSNRLFHFVKFKPKFSCCRIEFCQCGQSPR